MIVATSIGLASSSPMSVFVRSARNRRQSESEPSGYEVVPVFEVEAFNNAQQNDVFVIDEYLVKVRDDENIGDLELAESSHIFRPLFRYRAQIEERRRLNRGVSVKPVPSPQQRVRRYY